MFTERFVEFIQSQHIKPYHIAKGTGISAGLMSAYKRGEKIPSVENLIIIADFLDCSIDYLLGRTNNQNAHKIISNEIKDYKNQKAAISGNSD